MKIVIADPHQEVRSALHLLLGRIPYVTEVSEAAGLVPLLSLCAQDCPDLVLFDQALVPPSRMQPNLLADLIGLLRRLCPGCRVVVMSSRFDTEEEARKAGADGALSKTASPDEVILTIGLFLKDRSPREF
jgi:DNA-binding NarL/FixJ family response regulator